MTQAVQRRQRAPRLGALFFMLMLTCAVAPMTAQALELEVGARVGTGWNLLSQPNDAAGEPTLLYGTAFTGYGVLLGPTVGAELMTFDGATLRFSGDLLYGFHRGSGYAEHSDGRRIDIQLSTHVVRLPLMVQVTSAFDSVSPMVGVGLEPVIGLMSGATVEQRGYQTTEALDTRPGSTVAGLLALGVEWDQGQFVLPVDLRFSYNPFVGRTTADRFDSIRGPDEQGNFAHGAYRVAFNWQIMMTVGLRFELGRE